MLGGGGGDDEPWTSPSLASSRQWRRAMDEPEPAPPPAEEPDEDSEDDLLAELAARRGAGGSWPRYFPASALPGFGKCDCTCFVPDYRPTDPVQWSCSNCRTELPPARVADAEAAKAAIEAKAASGGGDPLPRKLESGQRMDGQEIRDRRTTLAQMDAQERRDRSLNLHVGQDAGMIQHAKEDLRRDGAPPPIDASARASASRVMPPSAAQVARQRLPSALR